MPGYGAGGGFQSGLLTLSQHMCLPESYAELTAPFDPDQDSCGDTGIFFQRFLNRFMLNFDARMTHDGRFFRPTKVSLPLSESLPRSPV